jgi:hypothetical protein
MRVPTAAMLITPVTLVYPFHSWQIKLYPRPHARKGAMSESGQSRHFGRRPTTSGLPLETDVVRASEHVSKVPKAEFVALFDHLVGAAEQRQ